jgi:hypothetical protein
MRKNLSELRMAWGQRRLYILMESALYPFSDYKKIENVDTFQ